MKIYSADARRHVGFPTRFQSLLCTALHCIQCNLVPRAMPVRGLGLALALGKRNEIRNFIGCREINNLGAA